MDNNEYAMEYLVRERLSMLRGAARRHTLTPPPTPGPGLRVRLGRALVHAGEWLQAGARDSRHSQPTHG
jgi:hypothetical protein